MNHRSVLIAIALLSAAACSDRAAITAPATNASPSTTRRFDVSGTGTTVSGTGAVAFAIAPSLCFDVAGGVNADGTSVTTATCNGAASQQFTFDSAGAVRVFGDKCLDADMGRGQNGDKVQIWTCNGFPQQRWTLTSAGTIVGVGGKCVDVDMGRTTPGAKLQLWTCYPGGLNQKWIASLTETPVPIVTSGSTGSAELPRTYLNTAMPAVTGRTISVPAGGDLQGALNAAQPGDQVVLAAGASYVGNFVLPAKAGVTGAQWITVRTAGSLPAEGTRVGPADAAQMPKLLTPNNFGAAIAASPGAQGWRLVGLEISGASGTTWNYSLVAFGAVGPDQNTSAQVPSRLVLDRSYVHGSARFDLRRCVALNSASTAIIDSYLADCHSNDSESQAILGWNGPGPYKIANNHLEGGHEVVMFGGSDPSLPNNVPADIEIRRNHVARPTAWRGVWQAKNLLELKMGQRVLVEGNVFENNWVDGQNGFAIVLSSNNQDGGCPWCITSDVTFRSNVVRNTPHGFNLGAHGSNGATNASLAMRRVTITNNVVTGVAEQGGRMFQIGGDIVGVTITNNSAPGGNNDVLFTSSSIPLPTFVFRDNITGGTYTLMTDDGSGGGTQVLGKLQIPASSITGNVFLNSTLGYVVPPSNTYGPLSGAGFANFAGGDLTLTLSSPYRTAGTGGIVPGADMSVLTSLISGVVR